MNTPDLQIPRAGVGGSVVPSNSKAIAIAWLAAGSFDILSAFATASLNGIPPSSVLKSVASGVLGAAAFRGGMDVALLGLALHYAIMFGVVMVFWYASRAWPMLVRQAFTCGLAYGIVVYAVMNLVVLPLSAISFKPSYSMPSLVLGIGVHMLCVGLPIATSIRRFGGKVQP